MKCIVMGMMRMVIIQSQGLDNNQNNTIDAHTFTLFPSYLYSHLHYPCSCTLLLYSLHPQACVYNHGYGIQCLLSTKFIICHHLGGGGGGRGGHTESPPSWNHHEHHHHHHGHHHHAHHHHHHTSTTYYIGWSIGHDPRLCLYHLTRGYSLVSSHGKKKRGSRG